MPRLKISLGILSLYVISNPFVRHGPVICDPDLYTYEEYGPSRMHYFLSAKTYVRDDLRTYIMIELLYIHLPAHAEFSAQCRT